MVYRTGSTRSSRAETHAAAAKKISEQKRKTKATRRTSSRRLEGKSPSSTASTSSFSSASKSTPSADNAVKNQRRAKQDNELPYYESYLAQKNCRNPFVCVGCHDKKLARSSLQSHVKSKHRGKANIRINCLICEEKFRHTAKATDHVTAYHKVYDCVYKDRSDSSKDEKCDEKFSEFDRLKSHLKSVHGSEWPWVCGFCDLVLLYDLEFQVHIKQHTDRAPFQCPKCEDVFPDTGSVREHLAETHMPRGEQVNDASVEISPAVEAEEEEDGDKASEKTEEPEEAEEEQVPVVSIVENRMPDKKSKAAAAAEKAAEKTPQDENAVNREIAALLLNLHASRSASDVTTGSNVTTVPITTATTTITVPRPEDLSFKRGETAIDLSAKPAATAAAVSPQVVTSPLPASISNLAKQPLNGAAATGLDITAAATNGSSSSAVPLPNTPVASPYSFYPSLAAMAGLSPSSLSQMNSNYLLQNLLLGKMQQIASAASSSSATAATTTATTTSASPATSSSSSLAFPTQPLPPTQALTTTGATVLKPPPALLGLKPVVSASAAVSAAGSLQLSVPSATTVTLPTVPSFPNPGSLPPTASVAQNGVSSQPATVAAGGGSSDSNIPLLCGQIVAQLNGLLFLVHSLNNPQVEVNLQTNLTAIYARLQEIVAMVEQAKSQQEAANSLVSNNTNGMVGGKTALTDPKSEITRQLEKMKETKLKEEEKVAKHIQDYHRALLQQHEQSGGKQQQIPSQIAPLKETPASSSVVSLLKKQAQANLDAKHDLHLNGSNLSVEMEEAESTSSLSAAARRRRGRPPKNSNLDLSYSPPDAKRSRSELDVAATIIAVPATSSNGGLDISSPASTTTTTKGSASSKGIRNRVFCGECAGCLKNDDCGRCRYCQDKTKFGGQNRLRQKCLHRRCQMDTHRKRNSNGNAANNNSSNNNNHGSNNSVAASVVNATSFADVVPSQSPSPNAIYSGVDLARLAATAAKVAAEQQMNGLMAMKAAAATAAAVNGLKNGHPDPHEDGDTGSDKSRVSRSRQKSTDSGSQLMAGRLNSISDDESEDQKNGRSQSRIDKWKAKHEAMLKLAENKASRSNSRDEKDSNDDAADSKEEPSEENGKVASPEIPNMEEGVCIDFDQQQQSSAQRKNISKPHTRHNTAVQQALSV